MKALNAILLALGVFATASLTINSLNHTPAEVKVLRYYWGDTTNLQE